MNIWKSLDKLVAIAGGCLVIATGGWTVAAGAGLAASGASLLSAWLEGKQTHGPESERVLGRVRDKVRDEFGDGEGLSEEDRALLDSADYSLGQVLLDSIPPPERLAGLFGKGEGFVKAAATLVIAEVAARDDLFAETGARARPLARRFALVAIEAALESALTDKDYFTGLLPFVLEAMSKDLGAIRETQAEQGETLQRMETLLQKFEASATGRRAKQEIGDSRPFVVLARRINQEVDDPDEALRELTAMVGRVLEQKAGAERGTNLGALVDSALRRIAAKSVRGEFDSAAREAEDAFARWQEREAERKETERQAGLSLIEANIEQNLLRRDIEAVTVWVERRISMEGEGRPADAAALMEASRQWLERGEQKGLNLDLAVAVALARRAHAVAQVPEERGVALDGLGKALWVLGERERGTARLEEAVTVLRAALEERPRAAAPLAWATVQNNLGNALSILGGRQRGTARLEEAAMAYHAALEERTRERAPFEWARTKNNLGNLLYILGEREHGTARLEQAAAAYKEALDVRTRREVPLNWATTQNNLGNALQSIGRQENGTARLREALAAYRLALEERHRAQVPLDWAMSNNNIANVLTLIGEREEAPALLAEAVAAEHAALEEWTRERVPLDWAMAQNNLGNALQAIGRSESGTARLEEAVAAYRLALEERTRDRVPLDWAATTLSLALARGRIDSREGRALHLDAALAAAREAREVVVEAGHKPYGLWADHVLGELDRIGRELAGNG